MKGSKDKRINQCINDSVRYYRADLRSAYDYYPFGMLIPDRTFDSVAYVQLPDRVDTTINQRIKIQIPALNPGQIISLSKDGETYVLAQYQSGYTGAQYSANIAGNAIVNELSFEDSAGYLIIENTTLGGQTICSGIPSYSPNIAGTNYVVNCSQSIDTIKGGLLSEAGYLFGFNTQKRDDEIYGKGNSYSAEYWQYDSRLGRRWNVDPIVKIHESPYAAFANNPIFLIDPTGADTISTSNKAGSEIGGLFGEKRTVKRNLLGRLFTGQKTKQVDNPNYQPEIAKIISDAAENKDITLIFTNDPNELGREIPGNVLGAMVQRDDCTYVIYWNPDATDINTVGTSPLFEEIFHFENAILGKTCYSKVNGQWVINSFEETINDEALAKHSVITRVRGISLNYKHKISSYQSSKYALINTHYGYMKIKNTNADDIKKFLTDERKALHWPVYRTETDVYGYKTDILLTNEFYKISVPGQGSYNLIKQ